MAAQQHGGADDFDMESHIRTWQGFMRLVGWSILGIVLILLFLLWIHFG
jgi:hypothetical protein